jgi:hypothetical protein
MVLRVHVSKREYCFVLFEGSKSGPASTVIGFKYNILHIKLSSECAVLITSIERTIGDVLVLCFSNCGPCITGGPRRPAGCFGRKSITKTLKTAKTAFVGWSSVKIRRISYFHNFLSYSHYFIKYFKSVYIKNVVMVTLTTGIMFLLFTCMHFWVWGILRMWFALVPTAYKVGHDCRKFEKHCPSWLKGR